jgi:hypothetical protein
MSIDIDESKVIRNEWVLWLGWVIASGAGMLIGFLPSSFLAEWFGLGVARVISPLLAGGLIGFGQWLVLRNFLTECSDWVLAAGAGWGVGYALGIYTLQLLPGGVWSGMFGFVLFGFIVALVQWPILRREIPQVLPWIVANIVGWTLGFFIGQISASFLFNTLEISALLYSAVSLAVSGLISGAIIGLALIWIVRKPERPGINLES